MEKAKSSKSDYVPQLTWLRGIASLLVVVSHCIHASTAVYFEGDQPAKAGVFSFLALGTFGVLLFFALSGCTLYLSNQELNGTRELIRFFTKRFFRIWPAFITSLVCYLLFRFVFQYFYPEPVGAWIERQFLAEFTLSDLLAYLSLTWNITGHSGGLFNNAYWSLPIEFQYYLMFPLVLLSLRRLGVLGPILVGGCLYLIGRTDVVAESHRQVLLLAFTFCGGIVIGFVYQLKRFVFSSRIATVILGATFLSVSLIENGLLPIPDLPWISNLWNFYGVAALVATASSLYVTTDISNRVKSCLWQLGTVSFGFYLFHNLVIAIALLISLKFSLFSGQLRLYTLLLVTVVCTYVLASLCFKYVESPSIHFSRKLYKRAGDDDSNGRLVQRPIGP